MPVQPFAEDQFTFIAGLNTEASYFTFPKNTWKDGDNLIPNVSGLLSKRKCIDLEESYTLSSASITTAQRSQFAYTTDKWKSVAGNGDLNYIVTQVGRYVYFYEDTPVETSDSLKSFSIDLNLYKASGLTAVIGTAPIKASSANGKCLITSKHTDPILVSYDRDADDIDVLKITVKVRDFQGVEDSLSVEEKPSTLTDLHKYNLYNQGWPSDKVTSYYSSKSVYPSNAQSWVYGKDSSDNFDSGVLDKQDFGSSPAPRGRYILDAFYEDRATASGIAGLAVVSESYRPAVCCFFAGRAWYAGIESSRVGTTVYFSQVAVDSDKYGLCYQSADPTSEVLSDLVDSDGGTIPIQDCGQIVDIVASNNGVVVFASNGIWKILPTAQNGFTATGYEVRKISSFGCVNRKSIVDVDDTLMYWGYSAICAVTTSQVGDAVVQSLTDLNIKSLYVDIPAVAKKYSSGEYNSSSKVVYWLYNEGLTDTSNFPYKKTHILALDVRLTSFYTLSLPTESTLPFIVDASTTKETLDALTEESVVDEDGIPVTDEDDATVTADTSVVYASQQQFKFLTMVPVEGEHFWTFSDFLTTQDAPNCFKDWYSVDNIGVSYYTYLLTGYGFGTGGPSRMKQLMYVTTFLKRTETGFDEDYNPLNESSCKLSVRWDFTDNSIAGKWTASQQVYRHKRMFIPSSTAFDDGYPVVSTKSKLRGRGKALQVLYEAEANYDMQLLGWSVIGYGSTNV